MKNTKQQQKVRITLDLNPEFYDRLNRLEKDVGSESKASLIREALRLYEYVARKTVEGHSFCVVDKDGARKEIVFFTGTACP